MSSPFLDAFDAADDAQRAPVAPETARARMRAALGPDQLEVLDDPCRFIALRTARAAGKTSTMVSDAFDGMSSVRDWRGCYGALTKDSGIEQLWDEIRRQDHEFGFGLRYIEAEGTVIYPPTGGRLRVRSLETIGEVDKWRGKQYHKLYADECQSTLDAVLRYAIITALPPTLSRHRGSMMLGGTPRTRTDGWWYALTGPEAVLARQFADGSVRAVARPWRERDEPQWQEAAWSWSLHNWPRSANPGLADADRESDELRRALAVTDDDQSAIAVELDGEWPSRDASMPIYQYNSLRDDWDAGPAEENYWLPDGHDWGFYLGADLAFRPDKFALALFAAALTSRIAYHCDEFAMAGLTTAMMAAEIQRFRNLLDGRLKAIVGDSQGPTGHLIFEELTRVHGLPIEKAMKRDKDDAVELYNSDLVGGRLKIKKDSLLSKQLRKLRKINPTKLVSQQPKQDDDVADASLYARRRMIHVFGRDPVETDPEAAKRESYRRQLRSMKAQTKKDPWSSLRGPTRPW